MFGLRIIKIDGHSMEPAITAGSFVLVRTWGVFPKVGDVVLFRWDGENMLKRITAINESRAELLGDNSDDSTDSRQFGSLPLSDIKGKAILW